MGTNAPALPPGLTWYGEYDTSFRSGIAHGFILTGDVRGLNTEGVSQRSFLISALAQKYKVVVLYNRALGFSFPPVLESARQAANEFLSMQPAGQSARVSALREQVRQSMNSPVETSNDQFSGVPRPLEAVRLLERLLRSEKARGQVAVIIDHAEHLCPNQDKPLMPPEDRDVLITLLTWGQDPAMGNCNNPIFLLSSQLAELHGDLRSSGSGYRVLDVPLPAREERAAYLRRYRARREAQGKTILLQNDLTEDELANVTAGLNLRHIEDILLLGYKGGGVSRALVKSRKDAIITAEYSEIAEMIDPLPGGFQSLGGAADLIAWAKRDIILPLQRGKQRVPKGVLLVGPPGSGKTWFTRALAGEIGFNAVALKSENILGSLVGESERKLKGFFAFAKSLSPTLIFVDEIDQTDMSRRGNSSGNPVAGNLFNQVLQFLSDETLRGKVIAFFATNRPDLLDDAMKRLGRMVVIPVLLPDEDARREIVRKQAQGQAFAIAEEAVELITAGSENYSAADLAAVVAKASALAERNDRAVITGEDAGLALSYIRPNTPQIASLYTLLAVQSCSDTELLPPQYASLLEDRTSLQAQIKATRATITVSEEREARE